MPTLCSLLPRSQRDVHPVQRQGDAWVYDLARILHSETEEPSDGLSQIAAHVLATSVHMLRKLLFTKLSPSHRHKPRRDLLPLTPTVSGELMFLSCCRRHLRFTKRLLPSFDLARPPSLGSLSSTGNGSG